MATGGELEQSSQDGPASTHEDLAFTVDTHLLQELGALLVGRDSTAVVELIKNAYDADATHVTVHGDRLTAQGFISITDDGHGMTVGDFRTKFLRIAGRSKEGGERRSPSFRRRFTGAKGIGRLSAHKLGAGLKLISVPDLGVLNRGPGDSGFTAFIDWNAIEHSTKTIENARNIAVETAQSRRQIDRPGTSLTINQLHANWTTAQLNRFLAEVRSTRPDEELVAPIAKGLFPGPHLLDSIAVTDTSSKDRGFRIELSGDFAGSEPQWTELIGQMNWMIEVEATATTVSYQMTPSKRTVEQNPTARMQRFTDPRPDSKLPQLRARVFVRDGSTRGSGLKGTLDTFAKDVAGVRVYSEGFRVLPYGSARNDWLGIDADYSQRAAIDVAEEQLAQPTGENFNERVYVRPGSAYFGGVFLHDATSEGLAMVVNREGYLPNDAFEYVQKVIRKGIELSVRVRAAVGQVRADERALEKAERESQARDEVLARFVDPGSSAAAAVSSPSRTSTERLAEYSSIGVSALHDLAAHGLADDVDTQRTVGVLQAVLEEVTSTIDAARDEQSQIRVLASIGTQMGAFVHEINGVLGQARTIRDLIASLIDDAPSDRLASLRAVRSAQEALISSLERQAVYLSDSLGAESRRRRSRQRVSDRVATAFRLLGPAAASRGVTLVDLTDPSLRTIPMYAAELNVVLTNLVSNAVKAAAAPAAGTGTVEISTATIAGALVVRVANTGVAVDLGDSERWFRPFESTTSEIDTVLGQGLGLGLPLTRRIVEEYGGTVAFVTPTQGMATAIELTMPSR